MQYLGGKHRLAKKLVAAIRAEVGDLEVWEPFCGGLSMTVEFAKTSRGTASDAHPALMSLYAACRAGWDPPESVSEEEYKAAKTLPDSDPFKAFVGFGCFFGGKWFGGYARSGPIRSYAAASSRALVRQLAATSHWNFECGSFFDLTPFPAKGLIYCDPPYAGTTGYSQGAFPHAAFWTRCQEWAALGVPVYVSEFSCPVPHRAVLEIPRTKAVSGSTGTCVDKLFALRAE